MKLRTKSYTVNVISRNFSNQPPEAAENSTETTSPIRVYKERWLVAIIVSMLQIISSIMWMSYPALVNISASYYKVSVDAINWLTLVSYIVYLFFIFPSMWLNKVYGIRHVVYVVSICSIVGGGIRMFGTFEFVPQNYRYPVTMVGQTIVSITFPYLSLLPTQVSQSWFPDNQRVISTSITTITTYLGGLIGILFAPYLSQEPSQLYIMNVVYCGVTIAFGCLGFLVIHSEPPTPPYLVDTKKNEQRQTTVSHIKTFLKDIQTIFRSRHAVLLAFAGGGIFGGLPCVYLTIAQQLLCPAGYTNQFVAIFGAIVQGMGFIFCLIIAYTQRKAKFYDEIVKISLALTILIGIAMTLVMRIENMEAVIAILAALLGMITFAATPVCMELGVEICYPINEGISGSLFWISCQIHSAVMIPLITLFGPPLQQKRFKHQTCLIDGNLEAYDLTYPCLVALGFFTIELIALVIWCKPKYNRIEAEKLVAKGQLALEPMKEEKRTTVRF
ncbi:hypothetical protein CHUAL_008218 [Chamberlinius hualienensis]